MSRLLARFSSAVPQVSTAGTAGPESLRSTRPVNRTMRRYRRKPDSCRSCRGWKKLPDCRNRPANPAGWRRWACSMASAPRLAPTPTTGSCVPSAAPIFGSTSADSARAYAGLAEYHSRRSPGGSSTRWNGGSRPAAIIAAAYCASPAIRRYSGPSWTTTTRPVIGSGDQTRATISPCTERSGRYTSRHEPGAGGRSSQSGSR